MFYGESYWSIEGSPKSQTDKKKGNYFYSPLTTAQETQYNDRYGFISSSNDGFYNPAHIRYQRIQNQVQSPLKLKGDSPLIICYALLVFNIQFLGSVATHTPRRK